MINSLPSEIRDIDGHVHVVLRGPRSTPIPIANENGLNPEFYSVVSDAVQWVYSPALDAEIKFTFLNNHLSLDWPLGSTWPAGLPTIVKASLASARDAFAFYLQGKAAESIKVMSDLRRSLQDDVSKVQQATRDLLSAVWRDFAVAGVVLALRAPSAKDAISSEALKFVTLGVAVLLVVSLLVTIASNIRFNVLSNRGRRDWRKKLYGFISDTDWNVLVEKPISSGRFVFWLVLTTTAIFYAITIWYLFSIGLSNPPVTKGSNSTLVYTAMP
ncbi:hypothetical protein [Longimicrobium sp.]|uniref:hypothetical protein n=1 Tax=Longimicrobium sp. TaxID=2029185 RepID=UPI002E3104CE|nr:hypothetical protein [Longimicrobium sp.]HEX6038138.1 hypothetical protein [Longimicrobium sp.]